MKGLVIISGILLFFVALVFNIDRVNFEYPELLSEEKKLILC